MPGECGAPGLDVAAYEVANSTMQVVSQIRNALKTIRLRNGTIGYPP
jgi:hypothetical protein